MTTKMRTAEEMIRGFKADLLRQLERTRLLERALAEPRLPQANREDLGEMLADTEELCLALAALDIGLDELAKPVQPVRDELRG